MEKLFFILLLVAALYISCVIPRKDGIVHAGAGPGRSIHVKKQKQPLLP